MQDAAKAVKMWGGTFVKPSVKTRPLFRVSARDLTQKALSADQLGDQVRFDLAIGIIDARQPELRPSHALRGRKHVRQG